MANIISKSIFTAEINLPKDNYDTIELFITRFEAEVLKSLLGYSEYKKLKAAPTEQPYKDLIDGVEYDVSHNGKIKTIKWFGLANLIANYVYCEYMRKSVSSTQSVGESKAVQENSNNTNIFGKVLFAWAVFEELYGGTGGSILIPSAYNYINEHSDLFPDWEFTELTGSINSHDL